MSGKCPKKTPCACVKKSDDITSPINIDEKMLKPPKDDMLEPWEFKNFDKILCTEIRNEDHQIILRICPKQSPIIMGGGLSHAEYIIDRIDFHWGSAHMVNCERFPLETHILMYCTEYCDINQALEKEGAAAFAVLHEFSDTSSCAITKILPFIPQISQCIGKPIPYCVVKFQDFLPKNKDDYYRYTGSTTFEPIKHGLEWTIFKEKLPITRMDLAKFTEICDENCKLVISNYKEIQPIPLTADIYLFKSEKDCSCNKK